MLVILRGVKKGIIEIKLNSYSFVFVENIIKCFKGVLIIGE